MRIEEKKNHFFVSIHVSEGEGTFSNHGLLAPDVAHSLPVQFNNSCTLLA